MNGDIDIMTMSLNEAWEMFVVMNDNPSSNEYMKARWGIKIHFDIYEHMDGSFQQKSKAGKIYIRGAAYDKSDYNSELEVRKKIVKNWLLENMKEENIFGPRERKEKK